MEKFSNWRDKGTGISPFMPTPSPLASASSFKKVWLGSLKFVIFTTRFPLVLVLWLAYFISSSKALLRVILLVCFGLNKLDVSVDGIKRSNIEGIEATLPKVNDLVVVNYISPIDGLIYALLSGVSWRSIVIVVPNHKGLHHVHSIWSLFKNTFSITPLGTPTKLDLKNLRNKVVFLLLEGTPSNNKSVLPFENLPAVNIPEDFTVKSVVLKIPPHLTLPIPHCSTLAYLFELGSPVNTKNNFIKAKIYTFPKWDLREIRNSFEINGLSTVGESLGIEGKQKFYEYWGDYKVKKE